MRHVNVQRVKRCWLVPVVIAKQGSHSLQTVCKPRLLFKYNTMVWNAFCCGCFSPSDKHNSHYLFSSYSYQSELHPPRTLHPRSSLPEAANLISHYCIKNILGSNDLFLRTSFVPVLQLLPSLTTPTSHSWDFFSCKKLGDQNSMNVYGGTFH